MNQLLPLLLVSGSVFCYPDDAVNFPGLGSFGGFRRPPTPVSRSYSVAPCFGNDSFCEFSSDYPRDVNIDSNLLENSLIRAKIFESSTSRRKTNAFSVQTRFGFGSSEKVRACRVRRRQIFPTKARNVKGEYLFIVNDAKYTQSVEIEQCEGEGEPCRTDSDAPFSGQTVCKQKYATYKLYAISANSEQIYDSFSLPSACVCFYKSPSSFRINLKSARGPALTSGSGGLLPRCEAGRKLDLPRFVNSFTDPKPTSRQQKASVIRRTRTDLESSSDFYYPEDYVRRPRNDEGSFYNTNIRWTRDTSRRRSRRQGRRSGGGRRRNRNKSSRDRSRSSGCSGNFCSSPKDYPDLVTRSLLAKNPAVGSTLFKQVFDDRCSSASDKDRMDLIGTRQFFTSANDEQLCTGRQKIIFPRKALNLKNEWVFVVNIDNFTQAVEIEECSAGSFSSSVPTELDTFGSCLYGGAEGNNPLGTSCRQIHTEYKLLALSSAGDRLEVDTFMLPSACACYTQQNSFNLQIK